MNISKSILIDKPAEEVYGILDDFNNWSAWSPWLIQEPEAKVHIGGDGKSQEWEGKWIGSGKMTITDESINHSINYDLDFLKPWKSSSKVRFRLEPEGDGTKVTWFMDGKLPFFMFWMKKMMTALVGMDYDRGLMMLKEYAEKGEVSSKLDFKGESDFPGCQYIGVHSTCEMSKMGEQMMGDFGKIKDFLDKNESLERGMAFSIYHKWDAAKGLVEYTAGWAVKDLPENLSEGLMSGEIPATRIYTVSHIGAYGYLGNAWGTLYAMHRAKQFKPSKSTHPFEVYVSDPQEVAEKDLVTDIHFALR